MLQAGFCAKKFQSQNVSGEKLRKKYLHSKKAQDKMLMKLTPEKPPFSHCCNHLFISIENIENINQGK